MNDQNKPNKNEDTPKSYQGGRTAAQTSGWKRLLSRKWVAPAAFMAAAAIIVTLMWVYQGTEQQETATQNTDLVETADGDEGVVTQPDDETIEVIAGEESFQWPVLDRSALEVIMPFYDANASSEERQAAMIQSDNTFTPHMGIDLANAGDESFDVLAALSGKVSHVEQHPTNGHVVEITHEGGYVTIYQSLADVQVKTGDEVKQGTLIAKAGRNEIEKDLGVHLHFEVRKDGKAVNPNNFLD